MKTKNAVVLYIIGLLVAISGYFSQTILVMGYLGFGLVAIFWNFVDEE